MLRGAEEEDGTVIFMFILRGGDASSWNLEPLLEQALGAGGANRAMANMSGLSEAFTADCVAVLLRCTALCVAVMPHRQSPD